MVRFTLVPFFFIKNVKQKLNQSSVFFENKNHFRILFPVYKLQS